MKKLITILIISLFFTKFSISSAQSLNEFEEKFYTSDDVSAIEKAFPYKNYRSNNNILVDKVVQMYLTRESLESTVKKMKEGYSLNDLIYNTKDYILPVVDLEGNLIETQIYRRLPSINDLDSETKAEVLNDKELLNYYTENENELVFAYSYNDGNFADGSVLNADTIIEWYYVKKKYKLNVNFFNISYFTLLFYSFLPTDSNMPSHIHLVKDIHNDYEFLRYYKMSLYIEKPIYRLDCN